MLRRLYCLVLEFDLDCLWAKWIQLFVSLSDIEIAGIRGVLRGYLSQEFVINKEMNRRVLIFLEILHDIVKLFFVTLELCRLVERAILQIEFPYIL